MKVKFGIPDPKHVIILVVTGIQGGGHTKVETTQLVFPLEMENGPFEDVFQNFGFKNFTGLGLCRHSRTRSGAHDGFFFRVYVLGKYEKVTSHQKGGHPPRGFKVCDVFCFF